MLSNLNALIITWGITLCIVIGGVTALEMTWDEPAAVSTDEKVEPADKSGESDASGTRDSAKPSQRPASQGDAPLTATATADMLEVQADGSELPRIASDGRMAWQVYAARQPVTSLQPKIALILTDIGMNTRLSRDAIRALPASVTLAISPYAGQPDRWTDEARAGGHETLLMLPMEPYDYPRNNPGDLTLLLGPAVSRDNMKKLKTVMGKTDRYIGLISFMGSSFTTNAEAIKPLLTEISSRGLMFVDSRTSAASAAIRVSRGLGVPSLYANTLVDAELTEESIRSRLISLENRARTLGYAVGIIQPKPITVDAVNKWLAEANERGFTLVPASAVIDRQPTK